MNEPLMDRVMAEAEAESGASGSQTAAPPPLDGEYQAGGPDPVQEWADTLALVVAILDPALPFLSGIYTDAARVALARSIVPVANKYGFSLHDSLGKWAPEIGLALVAGPLAVATVREYRAFKAAQAAQAKAAQAAQAQAAQAQAAQAQAAQAQAAAPHAEG